MKPINDRPTPLTDKAEIFFHDGDIIGYVKADFARQLERELAAANKRIAELEKSLRHLANRSAIYCEQDECCQRRSNAFKVSKAHADDDCITCQIDKAMKEGV